MAANFTAHEKENEAEFSIMKKKMAESLITLEKEKEALEKQKKTTNTKNVASAKQKKEIVNHNTDAIGKITHQYSSNPSNNGKSKSSHRYHNSYNMDNNRNIYNRMNGDKNTCCHIPLSYFSQSSRNYSRFDREQHQYVRCHKYYPTNNAQHDNVNNRHNNNHGCNLSHDKRKSDSSNCSKSTSTSKRHRAFQIDQQSNWNCRNTNPTAREKNITFCYQINR